MKYLQKLTALILAIAMATSTMVSASTSFTDDDEIEYQEAVEVMVAIGVINGYSDGSYNPTGDITRAEMAKLVAYILNEGEDVNDDYAGLNTFYDCGSWYWASGYIAFAELMGIICGDGHGYFLPDDTVTGVEAAKMLLVALGYRADYEGYTGETWASNVIKDAKSAGLVDDMSSFSWYANLSRDDAAMLMFNALQATMVEYNGSSTTITTNDVTINTGIPSTDEVYNKSSNHYDDEDSNETMELCEEYFSDLTRQSDDEDLLGRAAHTWEFDKDTIGTYADESDYLFLADDYVTNDSGDLLDMIQDLADDDLEFYEDGGLYEVEVYLNGDMVSERTSNGTYCADNYTELDDVEIQLGDVVEIYDDGDEIYKIVIIRYTYDVIEEIEDDDDIDDCYIETDEGYEMNYDDSVNFAAIYAVADEGDDILLVVNENDNIVYAEWPTIVSGDITTVYTDSYLKMDGTTYYLTANAGDPDLTDDDDTAIIYLNQYGYVVYCDTTDTSNNDNAVAVFKTYSSLNSDSEIVDMAKVVYSDGTTEGIEIGSVENDGYYPYGNYDAYVGGFYTFDEDDDEYDLTAAASSNSDGDTLVLVDTIPVSTDDFDPFSSNSRYYFQDTTLTGDGYNYYYYDSDVYFIFVDTDDNDVTVYEGVTSYTVDAGESAEVMVVLADDRERIVAVFVVGTADGETADDVVYIDGSKTGTMSLNGETYYTYDAYLDGDEIDDFYADISGASNNFYEYSIGDDGEYELSSVTSYVTGDDEEYAYCAFLTIEEIVSARYILFTDDGNGVYDTEDFNMASAEIWNFVNDDNINTASKLEDLWEDTQDPTSEYYKATIQVTVVGETEDYTLSAVYITGITYYVESSNATISDVTYDGQNTVTVNFDPDNRTITLGDINSETVTQNDLTITLSDSTNATYAWTVADEIDGYFATGDTVTVTAEDGSTKNYTVSVIQPNRNSLSISNDGISTADETDETDASNGTTENNASTQEPQQQQQQQQPQQQVQQQPQAVADDDASGTTTTNDDTSDTSDTTTLSSATDGVTLTFSVNDTELTTTAVTSGTGGTLTFDGTLPANATITVTSDGANDTSFTYYANGNMVIVTITAEDGTTTGKYLYTISNTTNTPVSSSMNNLRR